MGLNLPDALPLKAEMLTRDCVHAALYKIATGEDIKTAPKPGMFDLKVRLPLHLTTIG